MPKLNQHGKVTREELSKMKKTTKKGQPKGQSRREKSHEEIKIGQIEKAGEGIRTPDHLLGRQVLYQPELLPQDHPHFSPQNRPPSKSLSQLQGTILSVFFQRLRTYCLFATVLIYLSAIPKGIPR